MQEFIITLIVIFILFRALRVFIFSSAQNAFNKAVNDFYKRQEAEAKKNIQKGKVSIQKKSDDDGEYVPYEEIK